MYRFALVDTEDEDVVDTLNELHTLCFGDMAPIPEYYGWWWIGWDRRAALPVAFCGLCVSTLRANVGYLKRAGVIHGHTGKGLQKRMLRIREKRARLLGFEELITDTTDNPPSANNLISCGYKLWSPEPWAWDHSLYWKKKL